MPKQIDEYHALLWLRCLTKRPRRRGTSRGEGQRAKKINVQTGKSTDLQTDVHSAQQRPAERS
jgi:hypothetical protein